MNAISRILGENNENTPSWPKIIEYEEEFRITSLNDARSKHESLSYWARRAIERALNLPYLNELLDKSDHPEVDTQALALSGDIMNDLPEEDWLGDDGLVISSNSELRAIIWWVDTIKEANDYVRDTGATGFLATANRHVSRAIGTWLKSIGVPFEYNIDPDA